MNFGSSTPRGPLPWPLFLGLSAGELAMLCIVWAATGSALLQWLAGMASIFLVFRPLYVRAGRTRPFPTYEGQLERSVRGWILLTVAIVVMLAAVVGLSRGLIAGDLYPGPWAIFYLVFIVPLGALVNRYGQVLPRGTKASAT